MMQKTRLVVQTAKSSARKIIINQQYIVQANWATMGVPQLTSVSGVINEQNEIKQTGFFKARTPCSGRITRVSSAKFKTRLRRRRTSLNYR
jgi:hypothetical protein